MTTFKYGGNVLPVDGFFKGGHYEGWRHTRITKLVSLLGGEEWFKGKTVLELACGFGHTSELISEWGAIVTLTEGRKPHVVHAARHHAPVGRPVIVLNQEFPWNLAHVTDETHVRQPSNEVVVEPPTAARPFPDQSAKPNPVKFDLVIHWGILYHLTNWQQDLASALRHTNLLCLESEVGDSEDPTHDPKVREGWPGDSALGEEGDSDGSRPSAAHVEKILDDLGCTYTRYDDADLNFHYHKYDWKANNTGLAPAGQRRFWLVRK